MTKKTTKREKFLEIVDILTEAGKEELVQTMEHEIELLDKKAATAKATAAKKKTEGDELTAAVEAVLTDEFATIGDITAKIEFPEATVAKVQYRLNALVANGKAVKEQVTVEGAEGTKGRKLMAYAKIASVDEVEA